MKKRTKQLITAAAVLAVLSGVFFISNWMDEKKAREEAEAAALESERETKEDDYEYLRFIPFETDEIVKVEMDFPSERAVFEKQEDQWALTYPPYETIPSAVKSAATSVIGVGSSTVMEENVSDWSVYGIGPESGRTTITAASGDSVTVVLGNKTPTGSGYYASPEGDSSVYMVYTYSAENLIPHTSALRDRALPQVNPQAMTYLKAEGERTIEMVPFVAFEEFSNSFSSLMMIQPYQEPCGISSDRLGRYFEAMMSDPLTKKDFVDDYGSLAELGLDKNQARRITYRDQDNNVLTLIVGDAVSNEEYLSPAEEAGQYTVPMGPRSEYYAMLPGGREVFIIPGVWGGLVEAEPFSLRDGFVRLVNIDDIDAFSFTFKGETWGGRIERTGEGDDVEESYNFNGFDAPEDDFKDIYQDLLYVIYEGEADLSYTLPKIAPEATIRYIGTVEHGGDTRADFYPYDDQYYIVSVDGKEARFLVGRYQIDDIVRNMSAVDF